MTTSRFPAGQAPDGREECLAAIETLVGHVAALRRVPTERLYEIIRPYFQAGWCVKDVLAALDAPPVGEPYAGNDVAWTSTDEPDRMQRRVLSRLRAWRLSDELEHDVMVGPYTAMARAMQARAASQRARAIVRSLEYDQRRHAADPNSPSRLLARQIAIRAATTRALRAEAHRRELAARADLIHRNAGTRTGGDE